jgi:hypothetical protein
MLHVYSSFPGPSSTILLPFIPLSIHITSRRSLEPTAMAKRSRA